MRKELLGNFKHLGNYIALLRYIKKNRKVLDELVNLDHKASISSIKLSDFKIREHAEEFAKLNPGTFERSNKTLSSRIAVITPKIYTLVGAKAKTLNDLYELFPRAFELVFVDNNRKGLEFPMIDAVTLKPTTLTYANSRLLEKYAKAGNYDKLTEEFCLRASTKIALVGRAETGRKTIFIDPTLRYTPTIEVVSELNKLIKLYK